MKTVVLRDVCLHLAVNHFSCINYALKVILCEGVLNCLVLQPNNKDLDD